MGGELGWRWDFSSRNLYWRPLQFKATNLYEYFNDTLYACNSNISRERNNASILHHNRLRDIKGAKHDQFYQSVNKSF